MQKSKEKDSRPLFQAIMGERNLLKQKKLKKLKYKMIY